MPRGLLGKKVGMTRIYDDAGKAIPVTVVEAGPCVVVLRKTTESDGYEAVQLGYDPVPHSRLNQPRLGHFLSRSIEPHRHLREFPVSEGEELEAGATITVEMFEEGQVVDVTGTSKGRGFAGGMKRHNFKGGPASHGSKVHRAPQSAGATDAQRVFPGKRAPGHMGNARTTTQGLEVVRVDADRNVLLIKGSIPGPRGGLLEIKRQAGAEGGNE
ncbi:MAG: 50S ribosomal protein L3 [candidate division WS1 bacterium]|nr:50S ribosomal protein L3 [candidate division WS1 bacterium]